MAKKKKPDNLAICAMAAQTRHMIHGKNNALEGVEQEEYNYE